MRLLKTNSKLKVWQNGTKPSLERKMARELAAKKARADFLHKQKVNDFERLKKELGR